MEFMEWFMVIIWYGIFLYGIYMYGMVLYLLYDKALWWKLIEFGLFII